MNRSSSLLFESLYDSSLLAGLSPLQVLDQSDEEEPVSQENGGKSPHRSTQERRCSELLANQEAEQQEAIRWGESSFNLSEWGDSLLVGQHFLERQSLLKHTERTHKEHRAGQHPKPDHVLPEEQTSETLAVSGQIQPQPISMTTSTPQSEHNKDNKQSNMYRTKQHNDAKNDNKPDGRQERKALLSDNAVFKHPHLQNAPESTFFCSPGLQEIFDHWPSMSDTTTSHAASTAEFPDPPQPSIQVTRKKGNVQVAACESDTHEEMPSRHGHEEITERPGSAADLIPPTQETPLVTPKVKLTTSSVQTPHAAQPLNSTLLLRKPEVTECPKSHPGGSKDQSGVAVITKNPNSSSDSNHKQQLGQNSSPPSVPYSSSKTNSKLHTVQNLSPSQDHASLSSPGPEHPFYVESTVIDNGFTPQLSQDASLCSSNLGTFSIIDVASDRHLFETFINEWKTKERYSLALACEKREDRLQPDGEIGGKHKTGN